MTTKQKIEILKKIPKRFFKNPRMEIVRILIDELQSWKDAKSPLTEDMLRLTDRLTKVLDNKPMTTKKPKKDMNKC